MSLRGSNECSDNLIAESCQPEYCACKACLCCCRCQGAPEGSEDQRELDRWPGGVRCLKFNATTCQGRMARCVPIVLDYRLDELVVAKASYSDIQVTDTRRCDRPVEPPDGGCVCSEGYACGKYEGCGIVDLTLYGEKQPSIICYLLITVHYLCTNLANPQTIYILFSTISESISFEKYYNYRA